MTERDDKRAREGRSASIVVAAIMLSKLAGLVRKRVFAHYFGTSIVGDVLAAAFRIGNLAQNLLGEGTLSASFIPVYARLRAEGKEQEAREFARASLGMLSAAVVVLSSLGVIFAPWLTMAVAWGFEPQKMAMTTRLVRLLFPMTGVLVLGAWALGVLNAHRRFFAPYAAPVVWSAAQIAALLVGGSWLMFTGERLAQVLALGAFAGAVLQLLLLLSRARPLLGKLRPTFDHRNPSLREAAGRLPAVLLGRGVIQLSGLLDTLLVSFLGVGANATFDYAQTLYLLPMSLLGTGEAAVALPEMARDTAEKNPELRAQLLRERLVASLTRIAVMSIPATVVLVFFGTELVTVLLKTGRFDDDSTRQVAEAIQIYGLALLANASGRLFATTFFALGQPRVPARMAAVRVVVSAIIALALMGPLGVVGVVTGAACAGWIEAALLAWQLRAALSGLGLRAVPWPRLALLSLITCGVPWGVRALASPLLSSFWLALLVLVSAGGTFALGATGLRLLNLRSLLRRG